jgi:drug/metabolite transporter (DMT)-like permease
LRLPFSKSLVLLAISVLASLGDFCLKVGMNQLQRIEIHNLHEAVVALTNPWVAGGTLLLVGFFACYISALSWADLTYVLPATAIGYVFMALLSVTLLDEHVSLWRWTGILLITAGVGFIANQPHKTTPPTEGLHL